MTLERPPENLATVDRTLDVLASAQRRRLLRHLLDGTETWVERSDLARSLARRNTEAASLETALMHHHLPKIADAGLIDYDPTSGYIRPTARVQELRPLLEACDEIANADG